MSNFKIQDYTVASYSFLKGLDSRMGAPNKLKHKRETGRTDDSAAQRYGKALDTAILKPDSFRRKYKVFESIPKTDTRKYEFVRWALYGIFRNKSRAAAIRFAKAKSGIRLKLNTLDKKFDLDGEFGPEIHWILLSKSFVPLTYEEYDSVMWGAEAALNFEPFQPYLQDPEMEVQEMIEWTNPATGVKCKGEPDLFKRGEWVADIKSTFCAAPDRFAGRWGDIRKYHYGEQVYAYGEGLGEPMTTDRFILAIEKEAPHACSLVKIVYDDLYYFRENFFKWCATFKHVQENDLWDMGYEYFNMYKPVVEVNPENGELHAFTMPVGFSGIYETEIFG